MEYEDAKKIAAEWEEKDLIGRGALVARALYRGIVAAEQVAQSGPLKGITVKFPLGDTQSSAAGKE